MDPYTMIKFKLPPAFGEEYEKNVKSNKPQDKSYYHEVLTNMFYDIDAITMANIDAIFNITHHIGGYLAKQSLGFGSFCNISDKYGWSYYFLYRMPQYYGYMKTKLHKFDKYIDFSRLNIFYENYNEKVMSKESTGVNVLITTSDLYDASYIDLVNDKGSIIIELHEGDITHILIDIASRFKKMFIVNPLISNLHFIVAYGKCNQSEINITQLKEWADTQISIFTEIPNWLPYKILVYFNLPHSTQILNKDNIKLFYDAITIGNH